MRPVLFQWRGLTIHSYPALLYLGLNAGVVAANVGAHAAGIDALRAFVATIVLIVPGLIGARLFYVASHWNRYRQNPRRIWNYTEGGAAQYGALAVVLPASVPLLSALQLSFGAFWDAAMFAILVTMIFGRIGCLLNGCCAGRPSRAWLSLYLPNARGVWERRIPTQCLEAGWAIVLLVSAVLVWRWLPFPGALFSLVTAGYAAGRLALESTREPEFGAASFTINHGISAAMIVFSLAALTARWPK
jgi:phosphatidylglycerol:prolipoprotein diacylglycerol transferase